MLNSLITSQTRIKLLRKFFLNSNIKAHLRGLESEFGESCNGIRVELNRFEEAGLLTSEINGNRKMYQANLSHPLYYDIHNIILKETGIDKIIDIVLDRMSEIKSLYLTGDLACGRESSIIDLVLVGDNIDIQFLNDKIRQAEELTGRKVKYSMLESFGSEEILSALPGELFRIKNSNVEI